MSTESQQQMKKKLFMLRQPDGTLLKEFFFENKQQAKHERNIKNEGKPRNARKWSVTPGPDHRKWKGSETTSSATSES